jgi:K+-sensing histidine kinase KdpD
VYIERKYAERSPRICAHGGELNQVWTNIVDNAVDAMNGQGKLKVKTSRNDGHVLVEIADAGAGISREIKTVSSSLSSQPKGSARVRGWDSTSSGASSRDTEARSASIPSPERRAKVR